MTSVLVETFFDEATFTATHLVWDPRTQKAAIIDPVLDLDMRSGRVWDGSVNGVLAAAEAKGLQILYVLETHAHADHLSAAQIIKKRTGAEIVIGSGIAQVIDTFAPLFAMSAEEGRGAWFDRLVSDGDTLLLGELSITVVATPGHTPACVSYHIADALFVGDTLFMPDYGTARCDFPGGDAATLYRSIRKLLAFPPQTRMFLCHDYKAPGRESFAWETTVAAQCATNVHVHNGVSEEAFVAMRHKRDATLAAPALLYPSLQVNIRAGRLPDPGANGRRYVKTPLTIDAKDLA
jgi:glyoxylase-like metal-dependent hydrolase (beta-lactamase superfamily II)